LLEGFITYEKWFGTLIRAALRLFTYYAQVQGQMGITGAEWCDFVVYTKKGMSIEQIPIDPQYWDELVGKLLCYNCEHFIDSAVLEAL